jgi:Activator of Hsp90 ATPase homolog 1-like protein
MQTIEFIQNMADKDGEKADPIKLGLPPDFPRDQRNLVTFKAARGNKTEMTVTQYEWMVGQMLAFAEAGWNQSLDKMAASFAKA